MTINQSMLSRSAPLNSTSTRNLAPSSYGFMGHLLSLILLVLLIGTIIISCLTPLNSASTINLTLIITQEKGKINCTDSLYYFLIEKERKTLPKKDNFIKKLSLFSLSLKRTSQLSSEKDNIHIYVY